MNPPLDPALARAAAALAAGDPGTALAHARSAAPSPAEIWRLRHLTGVALQQQDLADDAAATLSRLLRDPHCPSTVVHDTLQRLADLCLNRFGDAVAARVLLGRLSSVPGYKFRAELAGIVADQYTGDADAVDLSSRMRALAAMHLGEPSNASTSRNGRRLRGRRIRIALVSNQWCASPAAFLAFGALREMARHADLLFIDRGGKKDWARAAFQSLAHEWHDLQSADTDQIHEALLNADADALMDMAGWTDPQALQAVARRPAPRQLKWVGGQSGTTGSGCFDGFVADARQVPAGCEGLYSEPVLRAPTNYVSYTPPPYWKPGQAVRHPPAAATAATTPGLYAIAANPAKISRRTAEFLLTLKPRRLLLIDQRWRHQQTRRAAATRLGAAMDVADFVMPSSHPEYLDALRGAPATFVDTAPYSMGLSAVELRLLGKPIVQPPRPALRSMSECHCAGHLGSASFAHHAQLGRALLGWCKSGPA